MTLNKYNEYMSHIEVTDEMKRRVLENVSKAIGEQKADAGAAPVVTPLPVKKKHISIVPIISIAASVLIIGGIAFMFISGYMNSGSSKKSKTYNVKTDTAVAEAADEDPAEADGGLGLAEGAGAPDEAADAETDGGVDADGEEDWGCEETETVATAEYIYKNPDMTIDVDSLVPSMTSGAVVSDENGTRIVAFNNDDNSAVVYIAGEEDTDLPSMYLEDFDMETALVTNGVTDNGISYALINTGSLDGTYNAASFNHGGQTYLIVFEKPVEEENLRDVISGY